MIPPDPLTAGQLPFDGSWFEQVNRFSRATPWLHGPARLFAEYGVVLFALVLLWSWWQARRSGDLRRVAASLWAPVGALVALGLNQPIVHAVAEARPYRALPHVLVLVPRSTDGGFPSDHATMAGAVAVGVLLANRRLGLVTAVAALLMAATRVYVGAHFPGDVVAGLVFGGLVCGVGLLLVRRPLERLLQLLLRTPLRVLVAADAPEPAAPVGAGVR